MQKMLVLSREYSNKTGEYHFYGLDELNAHLSEGWKVVNRQEANLTDKASDDDISYMCYVLIEKE